ncbi:MAG: hypothetical protein ABIE42_01085 [Candidatus Eisenbacteria bacterium]
MDHERDERWAYVALAVLAVAYVVYRFGIPEDLTFGLSGLSVRLPDLDLGKLGKNLPYLFAPLFAVFSEVMRRRKARAVREDWERRVRTEGFLRGEENLKIKFVEGGRGSVQGDVRLTHAALYLLDKSGRREPMRFPLSLSAGSDAAVLDVSLREGSSPELRQVRVIVGAADGGNRLAFEFESREGEAWRSSLRRVLGKSAEKEPGPEPSPEAEPT